MSTLDDMLRALEDSIRPSAAEMMRQDLRRVAEIISSSGDHFDNVLANVQEMHPELTAFQQQLEAKKQVVCESPEGGEELWARVHRTG